MKSPGGVDDAWLQQQLVRQLEFGRAFPHPGGGAAWLDARGRPDLTRPVLTYATARMAHVYSLGALAGVEGAAELADVAIAALTDRLHDDEHGGWFHAVLPDGTLDDAKDAYDHVFVLLAASTATTAGRPGAAALLEEAAWVIGTRFLDDEAMLVDRWDRGFTLLDPYRGVNANMHGVEAWLAAAEVTGEPSFLQRALHVSDRVVNQWARESGWRVPEHFDAGWDPLPEHHRDEPDHPFQPYGATVGHGLEWSRLVLQLRSALGAEAPDWMLPAAVELFDRAVTDGWAVDGHDGFVYTTDWAGTPVVRQRMHWVLAEGICAAAALGQVTGDERYEAWQQRWWAFAREHVIDPDDGSWQHELDPELRPAGTVWPGRPDLYHSLHAVLLPRIPLHQSAALALSRV